MLGFDAWLVLAAENTGIDANHHERLLYLAVEDSELGPENNGAEEEMEKKI